jgi:hypothetical protein
MASNSENLAENEEENEKAVKRNPEEVLDLEWLKGTSAELDVNSGVPNGKLASKFSDPIYKELSLINGKINLMSNKELTNSLRQLNLDIK